MDLVTLALADSRTPTVLRWLRTDALALTEPVAMGSVGEITTQ